MLSLIMSYEDFGDRQTTNIIQSTKDRQTNQSQSSNTQKSYHITLIPSYFANLIIPPVNKSMSGQWVFSFSLHATTTFCIQLPQSSVAVTLLPLRVCHPRASPHPCHCLRLPLKTRWMTCLAWQTLSDYKRHNKLHQHGSSLYYFLDGVNF